MHMQASRMGRPVGHRAQPFKAHAVRAVRVAAAPQKAQSCDDQPSALSRAAGAALAVFLSAAALVPGAQARPEGVNKPEMLPKEFTTVIDVAGFLTPSEETRIKSQVASLEKDTGFRLRVLAQNYPDTPGLAVRDYWKVDDSTVVFVADPTFGDILNFNVGQAVDLEVPRSFWTRLAGKYGNKFFWQEKGENQAILNAVTAIDLCLREPSGRDKCNHVEGEFGEQFRDSEFGSLFQGIPRGL